MKKTIFVVLSIFLLTILLGCGMSANELANTAWKCSYEEDYEYTDRYYEYDDYDYYYEYPIQKTETKTIKVPVTEEWVFYKDSVQISVTKRAVRIYDDISEKDTATLLSYNSSPDVKSYSYYVTNGSLSIPSKSALYNYRIEFDKLYLTKMENYNNDDDIILTRDYNEEIKEEDESLLDKLLGWLPF